MSIEIKSKNYYPLQEQADRRVNCLMMGLSLSEADSLSDLEYAFLVDAWNRRQSYGQTCSPVVPITIV